MTTFLPPLAPYPQTRLRRNRRDPWSRKLVAESVLSAGDLIWPIFVQDEDGRAPVPAMPGAYRLSISALVDAAGEAAELGIPTIAVFPAVDPGLKDPDGHEAVKEAVSCSVPLVRFRCGGETNNYGDAVSWVMKANRLWLAIAKP